MSLGWHHYWGGGAGWHQFLFYLLLLLEDGLLTQRIEEEINVVFLMFMETLTALGTAVLHTATITNTLYSMRTTQPLLLDTTSDDLTSKVAI